jgi:23S rRNA (cytidine1920-2'-O)/16S rRNA (cytidine1409-2'-O)-methyltransferase
MIQRGCVLVDGRVLTNPRALVRADAPVRVVAERPLRGHTKLSGALAVLGCDLRDAVALDVGAAAGGFTSALLAAGATRVYAVDVGFGQLAGRLRADDRVVNLERTNLADLDPVRVPDVVDVVTMDLSYLPVASAIAQLGDRRLRLAPGARLLALVKPTFELRRGALAADGDAVAAAFAQAAAGVRAAGWTVVAGVPSPVLGARGAVEVFLVGVWRGPGPRRLSGREQR